jgi:hypothetical protein
VASLGGEVLQNFKDNYIYLFFKINKNNKFFSMRGTLMLRVIEWVHRSFSWIINCIPSFSLLKNISLFLSL